MVSPISGKPAVRIAASATRRAGDDDALEMRLSRLERREAMRE
jgi:hypothetical protein